MEREGDVPFDLLARPNQRLREHLQNVATMAEVFAKRFGAGSWGAACGLLHDIGKASTVFQRRVRGEEVRTDHSTAGARHAVQKWGEAGKLLAYCIAGHHAGLPDGKMENQSDRAGSLERRLNPALYRIEDHSAWEACLGADADMPRPDAKNLPFNVACKGVGFAAALFVRMLFSCLVDADRLDAEAAGEPADLARAGLRRYPKMTELRQRLDVHLTRFVADTPVRSIRAQVLEQCRKASERAPGMFSLTVPTGGGKTLSSLAFALAHAERHGLGRVVYVIPFTSIIEQNAQVFRQALADEKGDADGFVIEHHSNLAPAEGDDDDRPHPATENWDASVIVTTSVQFFESLFAARAGRCRKLHNLAQSVIILDEAQMLPLTYLRPCLEGLRELTQSYGASVVLCTATQPALGAPGEGEEEGLKGGLTGVREIMDDPKGLHAALRRVEVRRIGRITDADLAARLAAERQVLCIVPTRRMAREVFEALRAALPSPEDVFHLSALMCPQHRTEVLNAVRDALEEKRPCRVVSTTLVEAGVDLDFPVVYRAEAGIDSIAQAAGRCNREGLLPQPGRVFVFEPENGLPRGVFRRSAEAGRSVAGRHEKDLLHPDAVRDYFGELYWRVGDDQLDARKIVARTCERQRQCLFPFREIERDFQLIDTPTQGLIIPYDKAANDLVRALDSLAPGQRAGGLLRRLQRHTVSLYERDFAALEGAGAIRRVGQTGAGPGGHCFVLSNMGLYDPLVGLDLFRAAPGVQVPEDLIS
ncbi:CRISPR-associated helicase, Cas3 family [Humidesulfovibrio mexicanus]|uniref:CRISPR-associated helicase, Cas3 family n=1 Tax=Humidesulfovibrio mexicanus TaxID=147047 RepID=A0A239AKQ1_9BACT|nr:CRISPR-associated endonuclease Cas3'' [Humidesulfovibrio mexicanus]SNR95951.1 CRISPR-associated helicase, Cas3 family [Humidesulfovibrio mexicanus]